MLDCSYLCCHDHILSNLTWVFPPLGYCGSGFAACLLLQDSALSLTLGVIFWSLTHFNFDLYFLLLILGLVCSCCLRPWDALLDTSLTLLDTHSYGLPFQIAFVVSCRFIWIDSMYLNPWFKRFPHFSSVTHCSFKSVLFYLPFSWLLLLLTSSFILLGCGKLEQVYPHLTSSLDMFRLVSCPTLGKALWLVY